MRYVEFNGNIWVKTNITPYLTFYWFILENKIIRNGIIIVTHGRISNFVLAENF